MFSSGPNYSKLKTNLRLAINRLKLMEKKKTELAQKARKEIADYIATGKVERAKIRVEHIIREDYLVEAMEVTEMYCDLILARFGLIQQMKDLDSGLAEAISSLIWVAPRLMTDISELKVIADQLGLKYGKQYAQACREQSVSTISEKLIHKMSVQAPPKILVEKYLQEIAHNYNLEYTPDPQVMREDDWGTDPLISLEDNNLNNGGGASGGAGGGMNIPMPQQPFNFPNKDTYPFTGPLTNGNELTPLGFVVPSIVDTTSSSSDPSSRAASNHSRSYWTPTILLTNPQSLTNCFPEFKSLVERHDPDVAIVSETWFSDTRPASNYNLPGYKQFHDDRDTGRRGGGVAIYAKSVSDGAGSTPRLPDIKVPPELECLWVDVGRNTFVCGAYHAPTAPTGELLFDHIVNTTLDLRQRFGEENIHVVVGGDFNHLFCDRLNASVGLRNMVQEPTHGNSTIDLILSDRSREYAVPELLQPIHASRHHCVLLKPNSEQ